MQADTFVKTATVSESPQVNVRVGETIPNRNFVLEMAVLLSVGVLVAIVGANAQYDFQKKVLKDALRESKDEERQSFKVIEPSPVANTPKQTQRSGEGMLVGITTNLVAPIVAGVASDIIVAKLGESSAKLIEEREIIFQREVIALQKVLAQKLEAGFNALQQKKQLLTPTTFLEMVPHLGLPTEQAEIVRETVNHAIEAVNDTKPLQHFAFKDGASLLLRAKNQRGNPEMQEIFLQEGVDVVKAARPKINGMLQYKAYHLLEKLQTELATVYQQLEEPQKAQQYLKQAKASGISALEEGGYARFVAGFLEGLINHQGEQFTEAQANKLKEMLNLVANDVRPFSQVIASLEATLRNILLNTQFTYKSSSTGEMESLNLTRDYLNLHADELYNEFRNFDLEEKYIVVQNYFRQFCRASGKSIGQLNQLMKDFPLYSAFKELSPFPQTYAAELPYREALLAKGVKFEPYPNA